ncbi:MAG: hypothetical protein R3F43_24340 [bacterium]
MVANQGRLLTEGRPAELTDDPTTGEPADPTTFTVRNRPELQVEKQARDDNGATWPPAMPSPTR